MMILENKYEIGQPVYLITDKEQDKRIVTEIRVSEGALLYQVSCGAQSSYHYDFEISSEKDLVNAT